MWIPRQLDVVLMPLAAALLAYGQSAPEVREQPEQKQISPEVSRVTFTTNRATALEAITVIALQTHQPVGIVLGRDQKRLCTAQFPFDLRDMKAKEALRAVSQSVGYSASEENGAVVLTAPDITPYQRYVLAYRFAKFLPGPQPGAQLLSAQLSALILIEIDHWKGGWGASTHDTTTFDLPEVMENVTPREIADRVVTSGAGGLWIAKISPERVKPSAATFRESVSFYPYADQRQLLRDISCSP